MAQTSTAPQRDGVWMRVKKIYLCELLSSEDGSRQTCTAYRSKRSAKRWQATMNAEDEYGFSAANKLLCFAVIKELKVNP